MAKVKTKCKNCPYNGPEVGSRGNPRAPIAGVGEGPGVQELRKGVPFIGDSGKVLWAVVPEGEEADFFVTNAALCHPRGKEHDPTRFLRSLQACRKRLHRDMKRHPRKVILAMGNAALWGLTNNYGLKITQERGKLIETPLAEIGIMPVMHPAALLRGIGSLRQLRHDIHYAFDLANGGKIIKPIKAEWIICDSRAKTRAAVRELVKADYLAGDVETGGFNRREDEILCLGVAKDPELVYIFPDTSMKWLKGLFRAKRPRWIWHNGKFDIGFLRRDGFKATVHEDTMLLSYALDETGGVHDLEQVATDVLGAPDYKWMVKPWVAKKTDSYRNVPRPVLYEYLSIDVSQTLQIFNVYRPRVAKNPDLEKLYTRTLIPASEFLYWLEKNGIKADRRQIGRNRKRLEAEVERYEGRIKALAGYDVNPGSPKQMTHLLFVRLKLKARRRNTRKETLEKMAPHPIVKALMAYRIASKALSTYTTGMEKHIQADGRIYSTFLQHATPTGRLSSRGPNLQNIPRKKELRATFVAPKGRKLVEVDLNQAELRSLASLSADKFLCAIYNDTERSMHDEMSVKLFGADWTSEQRMRAKAVNFGIPYGREGPSLAEEFNLPPQEGRRMVQGWFKSAPEAHEFILKCRRAAMNGHTITTTFGRKKRFQIVTRSNIKALQNEAANFPHQSIASDICLHAGMNTRAKLAKMDMLIVNIIHDSLLLECPDDPLIIACAKKLVSDEMRRIPVRWGIKRVPFTADSKEGTRWGYLKAA